MEPGQLIGVYLCKEEANDHDVESELLDKDTTDDDDGKNPLDDLQQDAVQASSARPTTATWNRRTTSTRGDF